MITWLVLPFHQLSNDQLFELFKLRVDVFVVEQTCAYPELDEKDRHPETLHLLGVVEGTVVACARLLPAGLSYNSVSIGRIATSQQYRGNGAGKTLVNQAITQCRQQWPQCAIEIGAQEYLLNFYRAFGFEPTSDVYLEDGISHLDMKLPG